MFSLTTLFYFQLAIKMFKMTSSTNLMVKNVDFCISMIATITELEMQGYLVFFLEY